MTWSAGVAGGAARRRGLGGATVLLACGAALLLGTARCASPTSMGPVDAGVGTDATACCHDAAPPVHDAAVGDGDAGPVDAGSADASPPLAPVALGAWIPGSPGDPSRIDAYTALVGTAPNVVHWYQSWARFADFPQASADAVLAHSAMPMLTWEPWDTSMGVAQPAYALRAIIAGDHDAYIHRWALAAAAWGHTLYLRFAHEMNGNWYPWCIGVNGNSAAEYVAAWRHVVDIFRADGATNVRWVWCPNVEYTGSTPFSDVYPGDAYTDWIALDGYNQGTSRPGTRWRTFREVFVASHDALALLSPHPMMIAETSSAEEGGDKAAWIRTAFLTELPAVLPRVRAVVWFDENKLSDWRVNSSATSLAAFSEIAASPTLSGHLPP